MLVGGKSEPVAFLITIGHEHPPDQLFGGSESFLIVLEFKQPSFRQSHGETQLS